MTEGELRSEAVRIVDERHGFTYEFSNTPQMHLAEYDEEEQRLREQGGHGQSSETPSVDGVRSGGDQ